MAYFNVGSPLEHGEQVKALAEKIQQAVVKNDEAKIEVNLEKNSLDESNLNDRNAEAEGAPETGDKNQAGDKKETDASEAEKVISEETESDQKIEQAPKADAEEELTHSREEQLRTAITRPTYDTFSVYIAGFSTEITEDVVVRAFAVIGHVERVEFARNADGSMKGYGFVHFKSKELGWRALHMEKIQLLDREVLVKKDMRNRRGSQSEVHGTHGTQVLRKARHKMFPLKHSFGIQRFNPKASEFKPRKKKNSDLEEFGPVDEGRKRQMTDLKRYHRQRMEFFEAMEDAQEFQAFQRFKRKRAEMKKRSYSRKN